MTNLRSNPVRYRSDPHRFHYEKVMNDVSKRDWRNKHVVYMPEVYNYKKDVFTQHKPFIKPFVKYGENHFIDEKYGSKQINYQMLDMDKN